MNGETVNLSKFLLAVSSINSLADPVLNDHNYRVAFIAYTVAREVTYSPSFIHNVLVSGLLHDIGLLLTSYEDAKLVKELEDPELGVKIHAHAEVGYRLLKEFPILKAEAIAVRYHHIPYRDFVEQQDKFIPFASLIIHLADRVDVFVSARVNRESPFSSIPHLLSPLEEYLLKQRGTLLDPALVDIFLGKVAPKEAFWYHLLSQETLKRDLERLLVSFSSRMPVEFFYQLSQLFAYLIDFKSPFTATHSSGVAQTAVSLASFFNFTSPDLRKMRVAGLLHDVGKVAIPREILEKPGRLTEEEFSIMKSHVFYTFKILEELDACRNVLEWASYHHETLDGNGYPFKLAAKDLSLGSRIMAVADIFTALMEDRPYKKGLPVQTAFEILEQLSSQRKIDVRVYRVLRKNYEMIEKQRSTAQQRARELYNKLKSISSEELQSF
ncbi:HD-GYP domain-containing protein [Thermovibrio ammonificans]